MNLVSKVIQDDFFCHYFFKFYIFLLAEGGINSSKGQSLYF